MTVRTILAAKGRDVVTIEPSASLAAAAELLAKKRIGAIVILGADRRQCRQPRSRQAVLLSRNLYPDQPARSAGSDDQGRGALLDFVSAFSRDVNAIAPWPKALEVALELDQDAAGFLVDIEDNTTLAGRYSVERPTVDGLSRDNGLTWCHSYPPLWALLREGVRINDDGSVSPIKKPRRA